MTTRFGRQPSPRYCERSRIVHQILNSAGSAALINATEARMTPSDIRRATLISLRLSSTLTIVATIVVCHAMSQTLSLES
jgi:hypothetical protein